MTQNNSRGRLQDRVALITGAARGQGAAHARRFIAEGASVVIADLPSEQGEALARELGDAARWQALDVTQPDQWAAAVQGALAAFGKLDTLVNNAGIVVGGSIEDMPLADYQRVINVNQTGCWLGMKSVIPAMRANGGGSIVNVSSTAGLVGVTGMSAYSASKHAVRGMTRTAAVELGPYDIRVNGVYPGIIRTPMVGGESIKDEVFSHLPIPRLGRPDEVANLVLFLASDESSYCTGAEFTIDGGFLAAPSLLARVPKNT